MNPKSINEQVTGQKPFETEVGNTLMNLMGGSGLFVTPCTGPATYDFSFSGLNGEITKAEVKKDDLSAKYGNVYLEYQYKGRPSCLSNTTADVWVHYLPKQQVLAICEVSALRSYISGCNPKTVFGGDNKLTAGYLVPINQITGQAFMGLVPFQF